ncbi:MAG TPA: peptidyl-prolyl cis-trans isomerase [Thermoanaerobaculia bacterium]|nr:peptidyl-prolyl cis-trans isomerase [Thermoanaerobaculia bacterium]
MLKVFRDNLKKLVWVLWVVIACFVLLIFVDFGGAGFQGQSADRTAATVGDETITFDDFRRQYQQSERQAQSIYGANYTPELGRQLGLAVQALDGLVAQRILVAEARRIGLEVSQQEVRKEILDVPGFADESGRFVGQEEYARTLRANGFTVADFEREVRSEILIRKLHDVLVQTLHVSDQEIENAYRDEVERAAIRYLQVDARLLDAPVDVEPPELEAYFEEHRADFRAPERRSVDHLVVEPRLLRATVQLEESELRSYYDDHPEEFTAEEQVRARHILLTADGEEEVARARAQIEDLKRRIAAGEDFAALARAHSQDETTKERGGDLGLFSRGRYSPAMEEAAFAANPGDLVGPIESDLINQKGLHLVEVLDRREGGVADFEAVRPRIQSRLLGERSQSAAATLIQELHARVKKDKISDASGLAALAEGREGVVFESAGPFAREDNVPGFGRGTPFTTSAFELERGAVSEPIETTRGWVILRVAQIEEARLPELAEVEDRVREAVAAEKAKEAAVQALRQSADKLRAGASIEEVASELGVEVKSAGPFGRSGQIGDLGREPALAEAVFALEQGGVGGPVSTRTGTVLFQVDERTRWDPAELGRRRAELREQITERRIQNLFLSLIEQRRTQLDVHYNQEILESFGALRTG